MKKIVHYLKKEKVMSISFVLAVFSALFVHPDKEYLGYVDIRVLALLFCLMLLVKGFQQIGIFDLLIQKVLTKVDQSRSLSLVLILLCFFTSMLITNDVALITFVPFGILALRVCQQDKLVIPVVILQTIAANLGSMLTPIGNPQNLYLFTVSNMSLGEFFITMGPVTLLSLLFLLLAVLSIANEKIVLKIDKADKRMNQKELITYCILFGLNLLVVFRMISFLPALIVTVLGVFFIGKKELFKEVDYALLLTFVGFFIFVGNIGRIPEIRVLVAELLRGREILIAALFSQFLSNVPTAILLSGFTKQWNHLLVGVNVGGLGTLIASMASLISYKLYAAEKDARKGKYLLYFTGWNVLGLVILLLACMIVYR